MAASKYESTWSKISEYRLTFDDESLVNNLKCIICENVMADAVLNSTCGCQYCYKCIGEFCHSKGSYCPGNKEDCKEHNIVLGTNVIRSEMLNKRISKLIVKCPNQSCSFKSELIELDTHLRLCTKQPMECPYVVIGCDCARLNKDDLITHIHGDALNHAQLLIELNQNLRNELNGLKEDSVQNKLDIVILKDESRIKEKSSVALKEELRKEIEMRMNKPDIRKKEMGNYQEDIRDIKLENEKIKMDFENAKKEMMSLKQELQSNKNEFASLRGQTDNLESTNKCIAESMNNMQKQLNAIIEENAAKMIESNLSVKSENRSLDSSLKVDYIWQIDYCSKKVNTAMCSEPFYSNNYKLCLYGYVNSVSDDICIGCYVMKGDFDDSVLWPMRHKVTLSIINGDTMRSYRSETYKSNTYNRSKKAFDRTFDSKNKNCIGGTTFIKYSFMKDETSFIVSDCLVVSCVLSDP